MNFRGFLIFGCMALASSGCQAVPVQPSVVGEPLPVSGTVVPVAERQAYADALGGYLQGTLADMRGDTLRASAGYLSTLAEDPDNLGLRARVLEMSLLEGDMPTALRLARTLPPQEGQAMPALVRGLGEAQAGELKAARRELRQATDVAPDLLQFRLLESYLAIAEGAEVAKEVEKLEAYEGPQPLQARKLYHVGRMWLKAGKQDKAFEALERSNQMEPGALFTTLLLGNMYEHTGQPERALRLYQTFREKNPQIALLQEEEARVNAGVLPPAFATTLNEDLAMTLFDFGLLVWAQGAVIPARQLMNMALWLDGANPYLLYYAGIVDEFAGDYEKALSRYERIGNDSPVWLAAQVRRAEAMFKLERREEAIDFMQDMVRERPDVMAFHRALAEMAFDDKNYRLALRQYDYLLDHNTAGTPQQMVAVMYFARGASYERLGNYDKAATDLSLSLALHPNNPNALNYLGYMWAENGKNLPEALALLQKAYTLAPEDAAIIDSLGWAYYMNGQPQKALPYLEKAVDMTPDDATVNEHLGDLYHQLGRPAEAHRQWQRALELTEDSDDREERTLYRRVKRKLSR